MNRYVIALVVVVLGLGAVIFVSGASQPDAPTVAVGDEASGNSSDFVPVRPGQIENPGQPRFGLGGWSTNFDISSVPFSEISSGGPGKDGIPAVDDPKFESIEEAREWVSGKGPVIAVEIDGDARAYPLAVLTWHEITNDVVGGVPVTVTFCPLCRSNSSPRS